MTPSPEEYCEIKLTQHKVAIVSPHRFVQINAHKWFAMRMGKRYYAVRQIQIGRKKQRLIIMHREILGLAHGDKRVGDHANRDTLDNRDGNLRVATKAQNGWNSIRRSPNPGLKGVIKKGAYITSAIRFGGKQIYLGSFKTEELAHAAYCRASKELHGDFGRLE